MFWAPELLKTGTIQCAVMEPGWGNCGYLETERANFYFVPAGDAWISS